MNSGKIVPVILCGGLGTRLWPRSRATKPKPFLPLVGGATLFEQALDRCSDDAFGPPLIVTGDRLLPHVEAQLGAKAGARIIVEPEGKNTAAAIALAAHCLRPDSVMLVCPSDHYIGQTDSFVGAAKRAAQLANDGWLVSVGISAVRPETGFGYVKRGAEIGAGGFKVDEFVEKPNADRAREFVDAGTYMWNGGIFALRAGQYLAELADYRPDLGASVQRAAGLGTWDGRHFYPEADAFAGIKSESIDYAVMENTPNAAVVPGEFEWSDIGNWPAVRDARDRDDNGNSAIGDAELINCQNVLVDTDGPRVHVLGLENVIIVVDGDDILVTCGRSAQDVPKLKAPQAQ